jgi:MFS family permease
VCQTAALELELDVDARRNLRHNYVAHVVEGGLYMGAVALINASTVLPAIVKDLGGPVWLVSLMPVMMVCGVMLPPVLTAHLIDRLRRFKPLCLVTGLFQRTPCLLAGLALLYLAASHPRLTIAAVALAPLVSGVIAGISFTGWLQLVARTLPPNRRSSAFASRYVLAATMGIAAGWIVRTVLAKHPGATGYGLLHVYAFGAMALSYVIFALIRESGRPAPPPGERFGLVKNVKSMPAIIRSNPAMRSFMIARAALSGIFIVIPFLAIHARDTLGLGPSFLGDLTIAYMVGGLVGNVVAGYLGDRRGGKRVLLLGQLGFLAVVAGSVIAGSAGAFLAVFFVFGFSFYTMQVSLHALRLDVCPAERRSTALAITALVTLLSMLAATGISATVKGLDMHFAWLAGLAGAFVLVSLVVILRMPEPRTRVAAR